MTQYHTEESTRTADTCSAYLKRTQQLFNRYEKDTKTLHKDASLIGFIDWIVDQKSSVLSSTWKQYKASVVYFLETRGENELASKLLEVNSIGCLTSINKKNNPLRTSAKKKKFITENEENKIVAYLQNDELSFWAKPTLAFFKAILATGLRPSEFQAAELIEDEDCTHSTTLNYPILKIKNAKSTNGRSHGEYRHLGLENLPKKDLIYLKIALNYANADSETGHISPAGKEENWSKYYKKLRGNLSRVINNTFNLNKKRITFYSCRHQFIADLKASGYSLTQIAALTGHATDETASAHYGRRKYGAKKPFLPLPAASEVAKVVEIYKSHPLSTKKVAQKPTS